MVDLPYFKFVIGEWMTGDIVDCSMEAQGLFVNICALYWSKECELTLTRVQRKFNTCSAAVEELINDEIFTVTDDQITIEFLDEQFEERRNLSKKKSRAGKASAKIREANRRSTGVKQVLNKEEKKREEKKRKENIKEIPAFEVFKEYALLKKPNVDIQTLRLKYDAWVEAGWKDGNGKPVKNWKSKLLNTLPYLKEAPATGRVIKGGIPDGFGEFSEKDVPMPAAMKKRLGIKDEQTESK